jgi:MFS family permease
MQKDMTDRWPDPRYGWFVTGILLVAFTFSYVDRQVLNLLVEPIQQDLGISDTQISFLQGLAFVFTYVTMSIPLGRMVDRFNRVTIMIGGVLVWSATTIGCGLARTYGQLVVARLGVGAGEAALSPAAWSVLADYFPPDRLPRPLSVYLMGPYVGAGIAMIAGAEVLDWTREVDQIVLPVVGALAPWQFTFIAVGLPGVLIAALLLAIREPTRRGRATDAGKTPSWRQVFKYLRAHKRVYLALHIGVPFSVVMLYGLQAWIPTVLVRVYEWDLSQAGRVYGVIALVAGSAGVLTGPSVVRLLNARGVEDAPLLAGMFGAAGASAALMLLPWQTDPYFGLACVAFASFFVAFILSPVTTAMQIVTPSDMRGVVAGMYVVTTNVIGLALGPTLVAASTDYLFADPKAVAYSLGLVALVVGPLSVVLLAFGRKDYVLRAREVKASLA